MVSRYLEIKEYISKPDVATDQHVVQLITTPLENIAIAEIHATLSVLDFVTKALQNEKIDFAEVRFLFDTIISRHTEMKKYLSVDARIIHSHVFENAIVKIQDGRQEELSTDELSVVANLTKETDIQETPDEPTSSSGFNAGDILKKRKLEKETTIKSEYKNTTFLLPTSNILERFFSTAKCAHGDLRQSLVPSNLEIQLFLCINNKFWDDKLVSRICASVPEQ